MWSSSSKKAVTLPLLWSSAKDARLCSHNMPTCASAATPATHQRPRVCLGLPDRDRGVAFLSQPLSHCSFRALLKMTVLLMHFPFMASFPYLLCFSVSSWEKKNKKKEKTLSESENTSVIYLDKMCKWNKRNYVKKKQMALFKWECHTFWCPALLFEFNTAAVQYIMLSKIKNVKHRFWFF